jgi:hypothetical protein
VLEDRRDSTDEILRRLEALEEGQRDHRLEMVQLREVVGQDIRAYELFKRLLVSIDTPLRYEHDTVFLTNDEERSLLHSLVMRERKREAREEIAEEHRQWWQRTWGKLAIAGGAIVGASTLIINAIATFKVIVQ